MSSFLAKLQIDPYQINSLKYFRQFNINENEEEEKKVSSLSCSVHKQDELYTHDGREKHFENMPDFMMMEQWEFDPTINAIDHLIYQQITGN
eukprot:CAMPEP_0176340140 /NCGR_PEP_ID=MMETSP0126-20121128/1334_1 /TAXON_ID=141414 ORGANISM="Strombidinopsis acuminatum, Strain SPMC142" /NCGR_SAMPLE_ID=MMETSP0126 /ASSEMBLY_ACC=CAM_ASM_000229 /LENGTH=91 /DNA_ID=CAMNT_0017684167 /DNA_START=385 /DNA_END=660 /DNA_ORIENTATION=+